MVMMTEISTLPFNLPTTPQRSIIVCKGPTAWTKNRSVHVWGNAATIRIRNSHTQFLRVKYDHTLPVTAVL